MIWTEGHAHEHAGIAITDSGAYFIQQLVARLTERV